MEVSIIIPVGSDIAGLETTLRSLAARQWDPARVEIIVCNDGGGEPVASVIAAFGCIEARLDVNSGSYAARNAGIRVARARALAFIDADEQVDEGWLAAGLSALQRADYVGGRVVVDAGPNPSFWERVDAAFGFPAAMYVARRRYAPTANLFVRRQVFEAVGGFDEALRSGGDREFGVRVAGRGFTQQYCAAAVVRHPARGFREQLRKLKRTSAGNARLEVLLRGRAVACCAQAAFRVAGNLAYAFVLGLRHLSGRALGRRDDRHLLAAGHALIDVCYNAALFGAALSLLFRRSRFASRVPEIAAP